jgi:hypothetical protein
MEKEGGKEKNLITLETISSVVICQHFSQQTLGSIAISDYFICVQ